MKINLKSECGGTCEIEFGWSEDFSDAPRKTMAATIYFKNMEDVEYIFNIEKIDRSLTLPSFLRQVERKTGLKFYK